MKRFAIALCLVAAAAACSRNAPINRPLEQRDTVYTPRAAMLIHAYQPRRALAIIDSAVIVGNASPFLADFLRAKTYAESELDPGKDTTVSLCLALLQSDSTKTDTKSGIDNRCNVLDLLISIYRGKGDYCEWLKYSKELSDLEHAYGNENDALRTDAEVGLIMTSLGWREEGMEKLDNAINSLKGHKSLDKLDAFIVCTKRKIALLESENDFEAIIPLAQSILSELDRYELDPGSYAEDSYRIPSNTNRQRWADWYRAQALCYAANAFAQKKPSDLDSTKYYINRCRALEYGRSFSGRWLALPAAAALGDWDEVTAVTDMAVAHMPGDTSSRDYARLLLYRAQAAKAKGRTADAYKLMTKYSGLEADLQAEMMKSRAIDMVANYKIRAHELELQKARNKARTNWTLMMSILIIFLISAAFSIRFRIQRLSIAQKNKTLVRMIDGIREPDDPEDEDEAESEPSDNGSNPDPELFSRIDEAIKSEKLYSNKFLQRQDIIDRFGINRHALNALLNCYADGHSFPAYINSIRMQEALRLLKTEPGMSISEVAAAVGFSPANLREQFKRSYGMTPAEYRQNA